MYLVTNRKIVDAAKDQHSVAQLGDLPSCHGPNDLRLVEARKENDAWVLEVLPNEIPAERYTAVGIAERDDVVYASEFVAHEMLARVRGKEGLLFFVHGFNNNVQDVLERAQAMQDRYEVEVLSFSWPANGGGIRGVLDYKSDKRDAQASVPAFSRCLDRMHELFMRTQAEQVAGLRARSSDTADWPEARDAEARDKRIAEIVREACPVSVNMMLHSMGNYLYKRTLLSSATRGGGVLFDNVVLVAADVNSEGHAEWVDRIPHRKGIYITINEADGALMVSRLKTGDEQKARLGHTRHGLEARLATYVDFTGAPNVADSHAYFEGDPVKDPDSHVLRFFKRAFTGRRAETNLDFDEARRTYRFEGADEETALDGP